ncbi:MAG TPA: PRC-barrel domain-containing protein, partial [Candidatus Paceibacterota bacterium]|nr:PRC-barrel domain-containing protein [Candidatus Paceibacterota bacterium]
MRRNVTTLADVRGKDIVAINGEKIGSVRDIFYDDASGEAEWVTVATGILGMKERVIPVDSLQIEGERLKVPFTKDLIKGEPDFNVKDGMLLPEDEARLCSH